MYVTRVRGSGAAPFRCRPRRRSRGFPRGRRARRRYRQARRSCRRQVPSYFSKEYVALHERISRVPLGYGWSKNSFSENCLDGFCVAATSLQECCGLLITQYRVYWNFREHIRFLVSSRVAMEPHCTVSMTRMQVCRGSLATASAFPSAGPRLPPSHVQDPGFKF